MTEDVRETIELELTDDEFLQIAKMVHEQDITFNKMVGIILERYIRTLPEA